MTSKSFNFEAIGTQWTIDFETQETIHAEIIYKSVLDRINSFDKTYSRFRDDSIVYAISNNAGLYEFPEDSQKMFSLYEDLYKKTAGLFTPLIGNALSQAGYDKKYSLKESKIDNIPTWEETLEFIPPSKLLIKKPVILDFGGIGKGYLIDLIGELLEEKFHINSYTIDAGGDLLYKNPTLAPLRVGLENPNDVNQAIGVAEISSGSLCGSAGNRRKWGRFHHIINPEKLSSPEEISAVWTTAENAIIADAMATCLFLCEPAKIINDFKFEYLILKSNGTTEKSREFPAEIFYKK